MLAKSQDENAKAQEVIDSKDQVIAQLKAAQAEMLKLLDTL